MVAGRDRGRPRRAAPAGESAPRRAGPPRRHRVPHRRGGRPPPRRGRAARPPGPRPRGSRSPAPDLARPLRLDAHGGGRGAELGRRAAALARDHVRARHPGEHRPARLPRGPRGRHPRRRVSGHRLAVRRVGPRRLSARRRSPARGGLRGRQPRRRGGPPAPLRRGRSCPRGRGEGVPRRARPRARVAGGPPAAGQAAARRGARDRGRAAPRGGRRGEGRRAPALPRPPVPRPPRGNADWPDAQAARLGLARSLERSAGPEAARILVGASLAASRRFDRPEDPWWPYEFGPPGLAKAALDRLWQGALGWTLGR